MVEGARFQHDLKGARTPNYGTVHVSHFARLAAVSGYDPVSSNCCSQHITPVFYSTSDRP
jgi:hypothetical protein